MHEPQDHPACGFEQAIDSLERDSGAKALVKEPFAPIARLGCYHTGGMDGKLLWVRIRKRVADRVYYSEGSTEANCARKCSRKPDGNTSCRKIRRTKGM